MLQEKLLTRIDTLREVGRKLLDQRYEQGGYDWVPEAEFTGFRVAVLSLIEAIYGLDETHYKMAGAKSPGSFASSAENLVSILGVVQDEIAGGWLQSTKGLLAAEIFSDFLDMAEHLLDEGYKDAAAVIIGSSLEEHLRQLCQANGIEDTYVNDGVEYAKRAERMNEDLGRENVYNKLEQKQVTAWLDLRNKAAHGKYDEYESDQVGDMLHGVRGFMTRNPIG